DTQFGGDGFDWVRGGQGNDSLDAGAGDDWIWGDRGDDTVAGGAGADVFHIFTGGGLDRVTDFSYAQGDRVVVDYGAYSVSQVGADTVVDLGSGDRMVLVGVTASSLPAGWISAL
ncbi:MAG: calcium-binding protein, partial [Phenylobacterium sp.]|nr:calcium-binding protein [Phenylobacterium sp.]